MSAELNFYEFKGKNPNWENTYGVYHRDDETYKRIICKPSKLSEYHACINTQNGDIYLDDRRRKIYARHLVLSIVTPVYTCVKTAWHASIILPIASEFFQLIRGNQSVADTGTRTGIL